MCVSVSERESVHTYSRMSRLQSFHESEAQIKAIYMYMYVKFSPTKSLATHGHTCIWEAQQNLDSF